MQTTTVYAHLTGERSVENKEKKMSQLAIIGATLYIVGIMITVFGAIIAIIAKNI